LRCHKIRSGTFKAHHSESDGNYTSISVLAHRHSLDDSSKSAVVIVAHDDVVDTVAVVEIGVRRNEYLTRLFNYQQLENLLDYLLQ